MKLHNISVKDIVDNPWRDRGVNPIRKEHIDELVVSIKEHGFFGGLKGRRRNGKIELGCGHARIEAARRVRMDTVPIYIDDIDDDSMLRLMTDENATQTGGSGGAILNEVAAVTRRLAEGILDQPDNCPAAIARVFDKAGLVQARTRLRGNNPQMALGIESIRAYLGGGNPDNAARGERQIREAVAALKQSSHYDRIVDETLSKYPPALPDGTKPAKTTEVAKPKKPRSPRILDERTAAVFDNEHQFHAFRDAVTTQAAQKAIPVDEQLALAKEIMRKRPGESSNRKQISASYIKGMVHAHVEEYLKAQRELDKEEKERYLAEQIEHRIKYELDSANNSLRSLISAILKLERLAKQYPAHPLLGGFSAQLDRLVQTIKQFSQALK